LAASPPTACKAKFLGCPPGLGVGCLSARLLKSWKRRWVDLKDVPVTFAKRLVRQRSSQNAQLVTAQLFIWMKINALN